MNEFKVINNLNRSGLNEGRTHGMGFAFAKREGDVITTIMPISTCKDYLNDVIYSEHTGHPYHVHGLATEKRDIFKDGFGYLVMSILDERYSSSGYKFKEEVEMLEKEWMNAQKALLDIECSIDSGDVFTEHTQIFKVGDNLFVVKVPCFWCQYTYLISLYTLILRNIFRWDGEGDPIEFLAKVDGEDTYTMAVALPKLKRIMQGELPEQNMAKLSPHNMGIFAFQFPPMKP